ncbi:UNVERIFIED_CONTAM: hypothetical protein K2H54_066546 [Gekko kuhli]
MCKSERKDERELKQEGRGGRPDACWEIETLLNFLIRCTSSYISIAAIFRLIRNFGWWPAQVYAAFFFFRKRKRHGGGYSLTYNNNNNKKRGFSLVQFDRSSGSHPSLSLKQGPLSKRRKDLKK